MAICPLCDGEMLDGVSCLPDPVVINGHNYEPIRWGSERGFGRWKQPELCGDCATPRGGVHHHGCDMERCPACHGQALSCGCSRETECGIRVAHPRCAVHLFRQQHQD